MPTDLVDLLGAMARYFAARKAYNDAFAEHAAAGEHSFDWYGRSYIEELDSAYAQVVTEWEKVFARV